MISHSSFKNKLLMEQQLSSLDTQARIIWSSSFIQPKKSTYKPGGTALVIFGSISDRMRDHGYDKLGRWCWIILQGEDNKEILIIIIYQCCTHPTNAHGCTAFNQQKIQLSSMNSPDTNPRNNFYSDLRILLQKNQNKEVMIM